MNLDLSLFQKHKINCKTRDVVYELRCEYCNDDYVGETSEDERMRKYLYACE